MGTIGNILVKKTTFFNGFDISLVRYAIMFTISAAVAKHKRLHLFSRDHPNRQLYGRSVSGLGMILFAITIKLIDPSDAVSLFSTNVIYIAVLSRIFFKEMFSLIHIISLVSVLAGVILITQPAFLFEYDTKTIIQNRDR